MAGQVGRVMVVVEGREGWRAEGLEGKVVGRVGVFRLMGAKVGATGEGESVP